MTGVQTCALPIYGVKETEGIRGEYMKHDDDWHAILIRDVSPGQMWFKKARGHETYGVCKLGGFQWAKVWGSVGAKVAIAPRMETASREKQFFWAPVNFFSHRLFPIPSFFRLQTMQWRLTATVTTGNIQKHVSMVSCLRDLVPRRRPLFHDDRDPTTAFLRLCLADLAHER